MSEQPTSKPGRWKKHALKLVLIAVAAGLFFLPDSPVGPSNAHAAVPEMSDALTAVFVVLALVIGACVRKTFMSKRT